jgi:CBS domain-containing protein
MVGAPHTGGRDRTRIELIFADYYQKNPFHPPDPPNPRSIIRFYDKKELFMQVRDIMSSPAITVGLETKIPEVARLMRERQISSLPVVDEAGKLHGLISELDLIERNAPLREPRYLAVLSGLIPVSLDEYRHYKDQVRHVMAINAEQLMDLDPPTATPTTPLEEVMSQMMDPEITCLPVIEGEQVVGIVTRTDLVRVIERLEMALEQERT